MSRCDKKCMWKEVGSGAMYQRDWCTACGTLRVKKWHPTGNTGSMYPGEYRYTYQEPKPVITSIGLE